MTQNAGKIKKDEKLFLKIEKCKQDINFTINIQIRTFHKGELRENHHVQIQTILKIAQPSWMHDHIRNHFPVCGWGEQRQMSDTAAMVQFGRKCMRKHHHQYYREGPVQMSTEVCTISPITSAVLNLITTR